MTVAKGFPFQGSEILSSGSRHPANKIATDKVGDHAYYIHIDETFLDHRKVLLPIPPTNVHVIYLFHPSPGATVNPVLLVTAIGQRAEQLQNQLSTFPETHSTEDRVLDIEFWIQWHPDWLKYFATEELRDFNLTAKMADIARWYSVYPISDSKTLGRV